MRRTGFTGAYAIAAIFVCIAILTLLFPKQGFDASVHGVTLWWNVLLPALLPFFVISELMLGLGIVHFFGTLLDPLMRPLFRIPGIGGFVVAMGFASGYPVGARLTSQLWEQRLITREEGERLVAFTTSSDPIFLIGAVSIGFFHDPSLAAVLGIAHYGSALLVGFFMRYHGHRALTEPAKLRLDHAPVLSHTLQKNPASPPHLDKQPILLRAFEAMHQARINDGRKVGEVLSYSIQRSLSLILVVGGLVVLCSSIFAVLSAANLISVLFHLVSLPLSLFHIAPELTHAVLKGFFEVTLGAQAAGQAGSSVPLAGKVAAAAFILSWGGLSVHAQVISLLSHTPMRYAPFAMARMLHALLSATLVLLLWQPLQSFRHASSVFYGSESPIFGFTALERGVTASALLFASILLALCVMSVLHLLWNKLKN